MSQIPLKKFVLEWRYKPNLAFYNLMDELGAEFISQFPDWQRTPLALEVRNLKKHRRALFSVDRCFYERDEPDELTMNIDAAKAVFEKSCKKLKIQNLSRVGLRQWFAYSVPETFETLVKLIAKRFLSNDSRLQALLGGECRDLAYNVDLNDASGWKYNIRLGPMEKTQWFQAIPHDPQIYEVDEDGEGDAKTLTRYQQFPVARFSQYL
jgi:hypothetical protein